MTKKYAVFCLVYILTLYIYIIEVELNFKGRGFMENIKSICMSIEIRSGNRYSADDIECGDFSAALRDLLDELIFDSDDAEFIRRVKSLEDQLLPYTDKTCHEIGGEVCNELFGSYNKLFNEQKGLDE